MFYNLAIAYLISVILGFVFYRHRLSGAVPFSMSAIPMIYYEVRPLLFLFRRALESANWLNDHYLSRYLFFWLPYRYLHDPLTWIVVLAGSVLILRFALFRVLSTNRGIKEPTISANVMDLAKKVGVRNVELMILDTGNPTAYTISLLFKYRIYVSVGLLEVLTEQEVMAVIAHELAHVKLRHIPKKVLMLALLPFAVINPFAIKVFKRTLKEMEREADDFSVSVVGQRQLLDAIDKLLKLALN